MSNDPGGVSWRMKCMYVVEKLERLGKWKEKIELKGSWYEDEGGVWSGLWADAVRRKWDGQRQKGVGRLKVD